MVFVLHSVWLAHFVKDFLDCGGKRLAALERGGDGSATTLSHADAVSPLCSATVV